MAKKTTPVVLYSLKNNALAYNITVFGQGVVHLSAETTQENFELLYNLGFTDLIQKTDATAPAENNGGVGDTADEKRPDESLGE